MAEKPQPRGFDVNQPGSTQETFTGLVQGATTDLVGGLADLLPYAQYLVMPRVASVMPEAADEIAEKYGSEALGEKVFGTAPTPELQGIRDDARLVGSLAGAGEAITARGANMVGDGISAFMKFLNRGEAVTPEGITAALPDTSVTKIMGGRMAKDGPSKFSEARAARRTKDEQEVFEETGAYFDDEVFPDEGDAFRFEIPTRESELIGIENVVRKSNNSSVGPDGVLLNRRNYFYMDDKTNVTGLKKDVVGVTINEDNTVSFASQFKNAAGELEPAKYPLLPEILDFPELYKQYPQLKDVYVARLMNSETSGAQAATIEKGIQDRPTIALGYAISPRLLQSHILHEIQHVVQKIEDFPRGGTTTTMSQRDYDRLYGEVEPRNVEARFMSELDDIPQTVPTQTRDTDPADMLLEDGKPAVQLRKAEGGVISLVDFARNAGRGPRGVESLVPVARNMNRSMLG
jgi:hypothetical protein